ncbi:MAG: hypothetical protein JWO72_2009 [Caulobacteraceae bacterium]|nr:hypothetical protein [Caulobacteraceae bacterium]
MGLASSLASASFPAAASPISERLDMARRAVEGRFLEAGDVLAQAVDGVGRLIASLDNLAKTLDPATVEATAAELKIAAASLATLPSRHAGRRGVVDGMAKLGDTLGGCIDEMRRDLGYLWVFAINIKIGGAGVDAGRAEFGLFAQEICDCIELGRNQLGDFDRALQALRAELRAACAQEQLLAEHCSDLLPAVPDGLVASAEDLTAYHGQLSRAALEVAGVARAIHKKVGAALAALQVGDSTRQRIEHVQEALALLAEVDGLAPEPRSRLEACVHGLLAGQLRAAASDFHRDVARIGQNMSGMAVDAGELLSLRDLAFGRVDGGEGFLRRMEGHVGEALNLVGQMEGADRTAAAVGGSAAAAGGALSAQVAGLQAIKTDVQQMALNTTLKCTRIGDAGKPLAVIALELRVHAGQLDISARGAMTALDALSGASAALAAPSTGDADADDAGAALCEAASRLRSAGDAAAADLVSLVRLGETVVGALRGAAARLDLQREIGAILDEAAESLTQMAGADIPRVDDLGEILEGLLARIAKRYTMAQERETHRALTEGLQLAATPGAPEDGSSEALDEVLF